ncbi:acyl carrier protein [Streptomyces typhae]|nr:acyl carrier protein [Streptomyces typhae]
MDQNSALRFVAEAVEEVSGIPAEEVAPGKSLVDDLGIDSLSMVEIAFTLQRQAGDEIPDESLSTITTVQDLVDLVRERVGR